MVPVGSTRAAGGPRRGAATVAVMPTTRPRPEGEEEGAGRPLLLDRGRRVGRGICCAEAACALWDSLLRRGEARRGAVVRCVGGFGLGGEETGGGGIK